METCLILRFFFRRFTTYHSHLVKKMGLPLLVSIKYPVAKKWHLTVRHLFREHAEFHGVLWNSFVKQSKNVGFMKESRKIDLEWSKFFITCTIPTNGFGLGKLLAHRNRPKCRSESQGRPGGGADGRGVETVVRHLGRQWLLPGWETKILQLGTTF